MKIAKGILKLLGFNCTGDLGGLTSYHSRRHGQVWFVKSPPLTPPAPWQRQQRNRFRLAAVAWKNLDEPTRQAWHNACKRARLFLTGYTLFVWWQLKRDRATLATIERQSGVTLV